jgi:hypothetical protein
MLQEGREGSNIRDAFPMASNAPQGESGDDDDDNEDSDDDDDEDSDDETDGGPGKVKCLVRLQWWPKIFSFGWLRVSKCQENNIKGAVLLWFSK